MIVRKTTFDDLNEILDIYKYAREQMKLNGNPNQWKNNRPAPETIKKDITNGNSYVIEDNNEIYGVFAFIIGNDPTYEIIENGKWLNDDEYGTIHRIASNGKSKGILEECLSFCETKVGNIRIDTHEDNKIMQHLVEKLGFKKCGIIYTDDGTPRLAYQKIVKK